MKADLEQLQDHITLVLAALQARVAFQSGLTPQEELERLALECQERIAVRELRGLVSTRVFDRLELSESERQVIWLLAAIATSREVRTLLPRVSGEPSPDPTLSAIRLLVYGATPSLLAINELGPDSRLRRLGILERAETVNEHEVRHTWTLATRVLEWLHGGVTRSRWLTSFCSVLPTRSSEHLAIAGDAFGKVSELVRKHEGLVLVCGPAGLGRRSLLAAAARQVETLSLLSVDARRLSTDPLAAARQLRAIALECRGSGLVPLVSNLDALDEARVDAVDAELVAPLTLVLATSSCRPVQRWARPAVVVELDRPSTGQLAAVWSRELGISPAEGGALAARFQLAPALIHHAATAARADAMGGPVGETNIAAGARAVTDDRLGQFARRVTVTQTWEDIVLPLDQLEAISELISRVRGRRKVIEDWGFGAKVGKGLGVSALFSGPPGTGKTMLASLIAQDLGLELYQVDLGKVVSKWIGETEKNLGALFDAAESGHAILLFDEADALFGKRTDVKSSNDRHANLETNYLLQRLESYTGVCLLTTNHDSHIDPAFQRRLSLHLRIELPEVGERVELWRAMLPPAAPVGDDLDFEGLARRYAMSGGYIRNAVLRAAFVAADRGKPITHEALERAARREYEGMGKIVFAA